jgi:hypothetical protein
LIPPGGYPPFPSDASGQVQRPRRAFWRSPYAVLIGGVVAAVVVFLGVVVGVTVSRSHGPTHTTCNPATGVPPAPSTVDQWQAAVCSHRRDAPTDNYWTHSATYSSLCAARGIQGLVYGQYTSEDLMQSDVARFYLAW